MPRNKSNKFDRLKSYISRVGSYQLSIYLLVVAGFLIRAHFSLNTSLWHDEAISALASISTISNGIPDFISGFEYWRSFPFTLIVAISGFTLGISDFTLRLPSILMSCSVIFLTYLTGKDFYDKQTGIVAASIITFSGYSVAWGTQVRMYIMLQLIYLLAIYLIYLTVDRKRNSYFFLLIITIVLGVSIHTTAYILPFIALAYIIYNKNNLVKLQRAKIFTVLVLVVIFIQIFDTNSIFWIINRLGFYPNNLYYYYDTVLKFLIPILATGIAGLILNSNEKLNVTLLTGIAVFPTSYIYLLHYEGVSSRFLFFSLPFVAIWSGLFITNTANFAKNLNETYGNLVINRNFFIIVFTLILLISGSGFHYNTVDNNFRPIMDDKSVYNYIENNNNKDDILITQWTPPATYYFRAPNYSLYGDKARYNSQNSRKEYSYNNSDIYSGAKFIDTNEKLKETLTKKSGWIVLRHSSYERKNEEIKDTLSSLKLVWEKSPYYIWRWNKPYNYN